ncbi:MAG: DUF4129 domain-containing protein, partial [Gammaproteobacteria bacterium]
FKNRDHVDKVTKVYNRFCKKLEKAGLTKKPFETATQFGKRVAEQLPDKKPVILKITTAYNNLHYGKHPNQLLLRSFEEKVKAFKL